MGKKNVHILMDETDLERLDALVQKMNSNRTDIILSCLAQGVEDIESNIPKDDDTYRITEFNAYKLGLSENLVDDLIGDDDDFEDKFVCYDEIFYLYKSLQEFLDTPLLRNRERVFGKDIIDSPISHACDYIQKAEHENKPLTPFAIERLSESSIAASEKYGGLKRLPIDYRKLRSDIMNVMDGLAVFLTDYENTTMCELARRLSDLPKVNGRNMDDQEDNQD